MELSISDLIKLIAILGIVAAIVYGILKFVQDFIQRKSVDFSAILPILYLFCIFAR